MPLTTFLLGIFLAVSVFAADETRFFFIDVDGGTATLIVSPAGKSLLIDAGWPEASAPRIADVALRQAGLKRIDYLVATHYHRGHIGGVEELSKLIPVGEYIDHGPSVESDESTKGALSAYQRIARGKRRVVVPGDRILLEGLVVRVVSAAGKFIEAPLTADSTNPYCVNAVMKEDDASENGQSIGLVVDSGPFRFLSLGDMTWNNEHRLACPVNLLGRVDVLQISQHGNALSGAPQQLYALQPRVAILNNGPNTPRVEVVQAALASAPHPPELWEMHRVGAPSAHNAPESFIANPDNLKHEGDIVIRVSPSGRYSVTNTRNSFSRTYDAGPH